METTEKDEPEASTSQKNHVKFFSETEKRVRKLKIGNSDVKDNWITRIKQLTVHQLLYANGKWTIFNADQNGYLVEDSEALGDIDNKQVEEILESALSLRTKVSSIRADLLSPISEIVLSTTFESQSKTRKAFSSDTFALCVNFAENHLQPIHRNPTFAPFDHHLLSAEDPHDGYSTSSSSSEDYSE